MTDPKAQGVSPDRGYGRGFISKFQNMKVLSSRPYTKSYLVLDGGKTNPLSEVCNGAGIAYSDLAVEQFSVIVNFRYVYNLVKYSLKYGISTGRLIAFVASVEARGVLVLEKSDQRNALRAVSFACPQVQIVIVQHSRFFESAHLHNTWGNPKNVRLITWGEFHIMLSEMQGRLRSLAIPMGSIRLALSREAQTSVKRTIPILVVLKAKGINLDGSVDDSERGLRSISSIRLLEFLGLYANSRGISLGFLSDDRESTEVAEHYLTIFKSISGAPCHYEKPLEPRDGSLSRQNSSAYSTIRRACVLVGVNSSILWEAVADAQPVVPVSFGSSLFNQFPKIGDWVLCDPTYHQFEKALEEVAVVSQEELIQRSKRFTEYLESPFNSSASHSLTEFLRCVESSVDLHEAQAKWLRGRPKNDFIIR